MLYNLSYVRAVNSLEICLYKECIEKHKMGR